MKNTDKKLMLSGLGVILDTSIWGAGVGIWDLSSKKLISQAQTFERQQAASELPYLVDQQIRQVTGQTSDQNPEASCLDAIASISLSIGPGSFTGIKIGWSYVFGLLSGLPQSVAVHSFCGLTAAVQSLHQGTCDRASSLAYLHKQGRRHGFLIEKNDMSSAPTLREFHIPIHHVDHEDPTWASFKNTEKLLYIDRAWKEALDYAHYKNLPFQSISAREMVSYALQGMLEETLTEERQKNPTGLKPPHYGQPPVTHWGQSSPLFQKERSSIL